MLCTGLWTGCAETPNQLCATWGRGCGHRLNCSTSSLLTCDDSLHRLCAEEISLPWDTARPGQSYPHERCDIRRWPRRPAGGRAAPQASGPTACMSTDSALLPRCAITAIRHVSRDSRPARSAASGGPSAHREQRARGTGKPPAATAGSRTIRLCVRRQCSGSPRSDRPSTISPQTRRSPTPQPHAGEACQSNRTRQGLQQTQRHQSRPATRIRWSSASLNSGLCSPNSILKLPGGCPRTRHSRPDRATPTPTATATATAVGSHRRGCA